MFVITARIVKEWKRAGVAEEKRTKTWMGSFPRFVTLVL